MQQSASIKPQDIALLAKLLANKEPKRQIDLAVELGISQGEIAKSLARLKSAHLVQDKRVNRSAALEFIIHAVKYVFPIELGPLAAGVPTAISAAPHKKMVVHHDSDNYVWPFSHGKMRGQVIKPFYPKLAEAALKDEKFYEIMAAIEILRMGRARERKLAEQFLEKKVKGE